MKLWLVLLFLLVPLLEFWIVIQVSQRLGILPTVAILVIDSMLGAYLVRREGTGAWRKIRDSLRRAKAPTDSIIDGVLIISAGALMLTPGFLTDIVGFGLLFPPTRIPLRKVIKGRFAGSLGLKDQGLAGEFMHTQVFGNDNPGAAGSEPRFGGTGASTPDPSATGPVGGAGAGGRVPFGFGGRTTGGPGQGDVIDGNTVERDPSRSDVIDADSWEDPPDHPRLKP